jgi:hypothetical protein
LSASCTQQRYAPFVQRAESRAGLGSRLPGAHVEDVVQGKIWAATDVTRRASTRQKDLADIARLIEAFPGVRERIPAEVLTRLL